MEYKRYENLRRKKCPIQTKNFGDTFRLSGVSEIMKKAVGIWKMSADEKELKRERMILYKVWEERVCLKNKHKFMDNK